MNFRIQVLISKINISINNMALITLMGLITLTIIIQANSSSEKDNINNIKHKSKIKNLTSLLRVVLSAS